MHNNTKKQNKLLFIFDSLIHDTNANENITEPIERLNEYNFVLVVAFWKFLIAFLLLVT